MKNARLFMLYVFLTAGHATAIPIPMCDPNVTACGPGGEVLTKEQVKKLHQEKTIKLVGSAIAAVLVISMVVGKIWSREQAADRQG